MLGMAPAPFPIRLGLLTSASVSGAPRQLHTCNSLETSTKRHMCHISNSGRAQTADQAHDAWPARTSAEVTDPFNSSMVIATSKWSRHAPSTSR